MLAKKEKGTKDSHFNTNSTIREYEAIVLMFMYYCDHLIMIKYINIICFVLRAVLSSYFAKETPDCTAICFMANSVVFVVLVILSTTLSVSSLYSNRTQRHLYNYNQDDGQHKKDT